MVPTPQVTPKSTRFALAATRRSGSAIAALPASGGKTATITGRPTSLPGVSAKSRQSQYPSAEVASPLLPGYSDRRATVGSTFVAQRAGNQHARSAVATRRNDTAMMNHGSLPGRFGSILVRKLRRRNEVPRPMPHPTAASWIRFFRNSHFHPLGIPPFHRGISRR